MSFVTVIRDYIDVLNSVYDTAGGDLNIQTVLYQSILHLFQSLKLVFQYFLTFQWFRDLCYLPVIVPKISQEILKENLFLEHSMTSFFTFLDTPSYGNNKFLIGFLNSFFLCLPLSATHLICIRRLVIQGKYAGIAAGLGTILGQWWFILCVILGLRFFIIPWFSLEPLSYIFGICLVLWVVYGFSQDFKKIIQSSEILKLAQIFVINFVLTWTEQAGIFQYLGNLTLAPEPTVLESFSINNKLTSFWIHGNYLAGLFFGSVFFMVCFGYFCLILQQVLLNLYSGSLTKFKNLVDFPILALLVAFTMSSFPFYGFDYLVTNPLGFVSQDKAFEKTIFDPDGWEEFQAKLANKTKSSGAQASGIDISPFDRGKYLQLTEFSGSDVKTFEDLNYGGPYFENRLKIEGDSGFYIKGSPLRDLLQNFFKNQKSKGFSNISDRNTALEKSNQLNEIPENNVSENFSWKKNDLKSYKNQISLKEEKKNKVHWNDVKSEHNFNNTIDKSDFNNKTTNEMDILMSNDVKSPISNQNLLLSFANRVTNGKSKTEQSVETYIIPIFRKTFSDQFFDENPISKKIKKFRNTYYSNPVYKLLLNSDIDTFLSRQPVSRFLSSTQEKQLFEKRKMLAKYYDSLRDYPQLVEFYKQFQGSKSYADRVYNQQFKGTLKVVRRLFSITLDPEKNPQQKLVVKYDQPLFQDVNGLDNPIRHEETPKSFVEQNEEKNEINLLAEQNLDKRGTKGKNLANTTNQNNTLPSDMMEMTESSMIQPFIETVNPIPFYTGWDEELRKLVVTNRLQAKYLAGYKAKDPLLNISKKSEFIEFTAWPLSQKLLNQPNAKSKIPYTVLFESLNSSNLSDNFGFIEKLIFDEIPLDPSEDTLEQEVDGLKIKSYSWTNIEKNENYRVQYLTLPTTVLKPQGMYKAAPSRGGFIWPGKSLLQFEMKDLIPNKVKSVLQK